MKRNSAFWGFVFILFGGLMMLNTLGWLHFNIWRVFWPSMVILLGIWVLWQAQMGGTALESENIVIPLEGARQARVVIHHGAGELRLRSGASPHNLLEGAFDGGVDQQSRRRDDNLDVSLKVHHQGIPFVFFPGMFNSGSRIAWDMRMNADIPLALELHTGANDTHLDLSAVQLTELKIQTGASATQVDLPAQAEFTRVKVSAGVASVTLNVPAGVAARVNVDGGLLGVDVDLARFPKVGGVYQSADYETAAQRVEINVDAGVGSISVQ
ncbi:MAG: hypothetical protein HN413_08800 [Chloroflexi bacterium]|jgi:hypothetical protein|nr:hypothetical protein [Chloroflexota bacterium]